MVLLSNDEDMKIPVSFRISNGKSDFRKSFDSTTTVDEMMNFLSCDIKTELFPIPENSFKLRMIVGSSNKDGPKFIDLEERETDLLDLKKRYSIENLAFEIVPVKKCPEASKTKTGLRSTNEYSNFEDVQSIVGEITAKFNVCNGMLQFTHNFHKNQTMGEVIKFVTEEVEKNTHQSYSNCLPPFELGLSLTSGDGIARFLSEDDNKPKLVKITNMDMNFLDLMRNHLITDWSFEVFSKQPNEESYEGRSCKKSTNGKSRIDHLLNNEKEEDGEVSTVNNGIEESPMTFRNIPRTLRNITRSDVARRSHYQLHDKENFPISTYRNQEPIRYVGLVNQAMTCYLNSLLQALYMTPEFRNALYKWEYTEGPDHERTSIPFHLQKLFLNLQTSTKSAVETTSLTTSFGWDYNEAWQQHDIQELCRVMFDALELKFKNTQQAELIKLYEGKMLDYVKCLECGTVKSREDKFLDIPLPVRPFDSNIAYSSVIDALHAFVKYETLDGNNQYFCEKCNRKCNAQKGLKFTKFPYLLTLHLKRFDFDCSSLHRIKLNDKVTFPDTLDLNSFISSSAMNHNSLNIDNDIAQHEKSDDNRANDIGNFEEEFRHHANGIGVHQNNCEQNDEEAVVKLGNEVSNGLSLLNRNTHNNENGKNWENVGNQPYMYELYAIMIHSGSASGGHYYAYIKDFETKEWLCFNDQCVNRITQDDIIKTYGGGSTRAYFSSAYSSSTNAYMLMYRQIDEERNCLPMKVDEFPPHIKKLLKEMKESAERIAINEAFAFVKVFCNNPRSGSLESREVKYSKVFKPPTWAEMASLAYMEFDLTQYVKPEQCRLVGFYAWKANEIVRTYDPNALFEDPDTQLLLQIRSAHEPFYDVLDLKVYIVKLEEETIFEKEMQFNCESNCIVKQLKQKIADDSTSTFDSSEMHLVLQDSFETRLLSDDKMLAEEGMTLKKVFKIYASSKLDLDPSQEFEGSALERIAHKYKHAIAVKFTLPCMSQETLTVEDIPLLEQERDDEKVSTPILNGDVSIERSTEFLSSHRLLEKDADSRAQLIAEIQEQSNSEDSSLSDSDRTLVGDNLEQQLIDMCHSPNALFVDIKDTNDGVFPEVEEKSNDVEEDDGSCRVARPVTLVTQTEEDKSKSEKETFEEKELLFELLSWKPECKVSEFVIDKRMPTAQLKKRLEEYLKISSEYFKVVFPTFKGTSKDSFEREEISEFDNRECHCYQIQLYRPLQSNEFKIKLYHLVLDSPEPFTYICDVIVETGMTVCEAKKKIAILLKQKNMMDQSKKSECLRLRKKGHKMLGNILETDSTLENIQSLYVQILPTEETFTSGQISVFLKRWYPSKMSFGEFEEVIVIPMETEVLEKINELSQIPVENLQILIGNENEFPWDMDVTAVHDRWQWASCRDGMKNMLKFSEYSTAIFYRHKEEVLMGLNDEEMRQLKAKETKRLEYECGSQGSSGSLTLPGNYAPRREKVLKIHVVPNSTC